MAGKLQSVFYKNETNDIIVKILHNEEPVSLPIKTDIAPFYKWSEMKEFYNKKLYIK